MAIQQVQGVSGAAQAVAPQRPVQAAGAPRTPPQSAAPPPSAEQVDRAVQEIQKAVAPVARDLQFSIDGETGRTVIRIVDSATQEVVRQIPTEEVMAISRALGKLQGLLIEQKA